MSAKGHKDRVVDSGLACERALNNIPIKSGDITRIFAHTFQYYLATHRVDNGTHFRIIKKLLGHSYTKTTEGRVLMSRSPLDNIKN